MSLAYETSAYTNGYEFSAGSGYELPQYPFVTPPELAGAPAQTYPVVVVGAGLAGLTVAASLATMGVRCVLLDDDNTVGVRGASSRGICYAQKTLEIFAKLGIYERLAAKGVQWSVGRTFAGTDEVYSFDLKANASQAASVQPPFLNIQQFYVEGFLVERVVALGLTDLRWQHRVVGFEQTQFEATLQLETPEGRYSLRASHVVDASGSKSPFRAWTGVGVSAKKGDDRWCIADVRFAKQPPLERHTWIEAPFNDNRAVWQHLMADKVWRLDYQMAPNCDMQAVSRMETVLDRLQKQFDGVLDVRRDCEVVWVGPYAYRSECVNDMRRGRVFFVGDSAHVVSPFGARGGNSGVQDADNLACKLASVLLGQAPQAMLDDYHRERHAAAVENVEVTNRTARFLRPQTPAERVFRDAAIALAKHNPTLRPYVNTGRMSQANEYPRGDGQPNLRSVGNASFQWADASAGSVSDLLRWAAPRPLLLWFGAVPAHWPKRRSVAAVQVVATDQLPTALAKEHVHDATGLLRQAVGPCVWALLRPDGYLIGNGHSAADLAANLRAEGLA